VASGAKPDKACDGYDGRNGRDWSSAILVTDAGSGAGFASGRCAIRPCSTAGRTEVLEDLARVWWNLCCD